MADATRLVAAAAMTVGLCLSSGGALAWPFFLDDPGSTNDVVGQYPAWPYNTQGNNGCLTCHSTTAPVPDGPEELNAYGEAFKANGHVFAALELGDVDGDGASNGLELSLGSFPGNGASTPVAPANLQASDGTHPGGVMLSWSAVAGAIAYDVFKWENAIDIISVGDVVATVNGPSHLDTVVQIGKNYNYKVRACNAHGCTDYGGINNGFFEGSGAAGQAIDPAVVALLAKRLVPQPAPSGVDATDGLIGAQIGVSWQATPGAHAYIVYRAESKLDTPMPGPLHEKVANTAETQIYDMQVSQGKIYWYAVRACYQAGCSRLADPEPGWLYTANPTEEMVALEQQGAGGRVATPDVAPRVSREPAEAVVRERVPAEAVVRERAPADAVVRERAPVAIDEEAVPPIRREGEVRTRR